jgi:uncharacterized membrane protein
MDEFRRFFFRGLAALLPTLVTIAIIAWAYRLVNDNLGAYITQGMVWACGRAIPEPSKLWVDPEKDALRYGEPLERWDSRGRRLTVEYEIIHNLELRRWEPSRYARERSEALWGLAAQKYHLHFVGFLIAIILVYFMGFFLASFIGRTTWRAAEGLLYRIPLIRAIYPNVKQVTDFLFSERKVEFSGVVAVQYPRKGVWSLALVTGQPIKQVQDLIEDELITLFVPSSPTPVTGYVIQAARSEVIELNMSIDEGLRFAISAGVIKPGAIPPGSDSLVGEATADALDASKVAKGKETLPGGQSSAKQE